MQNVTIRLATLTDIPSMAKLWHEKQVLFQQSDQRLLLDSDAVTHWSRAAAEWVQDERSAVYVGIADNDVLGYVVCQLQEAPPGLAPERLGAVTEMTMDLHSTRGGLARALLAAARQWFSRQGTAQIIIYVPRRQPVEQAFWRALGATEWIDVMWMKL